jgi:ATP-dependent Clp protease protease subunit
MIYCIDSTVDEPIMLLNKHIGMDDDEGMGIDGAIFQQEILQLDNLGKKRIQIWINSPGGVVTDGYNIYSAILKSKTPVDTYCIGAAASIAGVIFEAGRKRYMTDFAWLMFHDPFGGENGSMLKVMRDSIITMIEQRSGMTESDVSVMMKRTTFIPASEALTLKLCDQIDPSQNENTKYLRKITDSVQFYKECNKILNSNLNIKQVKNNIMDGINLTKVTMRLKLNDSAPADDIVKAIDAIEDRAKAAEQEVEETKNKAAEKAKVDGDELDKLKAKMKAAEDALAKAKADYEDCHSKLEAMEKDKKAAEDKAEDEKIKNMVEGFAKVGRIKNEASITLQWCNTAKKLGFDETKAMIEALPFNKTAVTITEPVLNKLDKNQLPTTAIGLAVRNKLLREGKLS